MKWSRYRANGYEVSSKGDKRFSALYARLRDGRTIEEAYQLDVKGYRSIGYSWQQAKQDRGAHAPIRLTKEQLWNAYLALWQQWAKENPALIQDLRLKSQGKVLTDMFAGDYVTQARALAQILTEQENQRWQRKQRVM